MKKFIFTLVIFGIGLLGIAFYADFAVSKKLQKSTIRMLVGWNEIYSGNLKSDVLIVGASRVLYQYSPFILDSILGINSYNFGMDGSGINRQIVKYDAFRRFNLKPKLIIQNIDFSEMEMTFGYEKEQFFPYFFDKPLKKAISKYENLSLFEKYIPYYRYIGYTDFVKERRVWPYSVPYYDNNIYKGYFGSKRLWDGSELAKQTEVLYEQDETALRLFDQYLAKACSENIQVIFVYAPIYIGATKKIKNIEGMYQMYDSIAKKYNIPILDYNYDPISYDTTYFYNATHMNKTGSELFSIKLAHDIDSLLQIK